MMTYSPLCDAKNLRQLQKIVIGRCEEPGASLIDHNIPLIPTGYKFPLAFSPGIGFSLIGKTAKRKAEEFLLQPK
jgi:hypothetical protein